MSLPKRSSAASTTVAALTLSSMSLLSPSPVTGWVMGSISSTTRTGSLCHLDQSSPLSLGGSSRAFFSTTTKRSMVSAPTSVEGKGFGIDDDDDNNENDKNDNSNWNDVLPYEDSSHNSATITVPELGDYNEDNDDLFEKATFRQRLEDTISVLRELKKSSLWVTVPMSRASLMEEMEQVGLEFHHALGKTAKLNMWLRDDVISMVPEFATHHIGVGAVVVNSRDEILCVKELRRNFMPWKIPGGLSELGESIPDAAEREVLEETGIPTKFDSILSYRQTHGLANGRSDIYFVCRLIPIEDVDDDGNVVIPEPSPQESEIEDATWMPMKDYMDMINGVTHDHGHPMMTHVMKVYHQGNHRIKTKKVESVIPGRMPSEMYHPSIDLSSSSPDDGATAAADDGQY